jgi:phage terminase large subunit-like protein
MGARKEPLTVVITTASEVIDGPFRHELEGVKKVLLGEVENDTVFASLFEPDVDDAEDDPHTWAKVQPHMGVTVQPDYYEKEWARAQLSAENMVTFRTKLLNVFCINEEKRWFTVEKAHELLNKDFDINKVRGVPTAVAFDLSVHDDFSCVSYVMYNNRTATYYCHTDYYIPEWTLKHHENRQLYGIWVDQGHLKVCKGEKIDVHMIANDIVAHSRHLPIIIISYDAYKAQDLVNILATFGRSVLHPYPQTNGNFNLPVESFEMMAYNDPPKIWMNDNPINAYCLENGVLREDNLGNKKPHKYGSDMGSGTDYGANKIDGTITMLMGLGSLYKYER